MSFERPTKRPCTRSEAKRWELLPPTGAAAAPLICPVCLESDEQMLQSQMVCAEGCEKHPCCLSCYERILLPDNNDVPDCLCVNCTNSGLEGKCPVCKNEISLFGLKYCCNGKPVGEVDVSKTPLFGRVFRERKINKDDDGDDDDDDADGNADELLLERLCFPSRPGDPVEYYTTGSSAYANHPQTLELQQTQFHAASRCFFGVHTFPYQDNPRFQAVALTVMFSFDYTFITRGRILWIRREFDSNEDFQKAYPVDGLWEVTPLHDDDDDAMDGETLPPATYRVKDGFRFCPSGHCTGPFHAMPNEGMIAVFYNDQPERIRWNFLDSPAGPAIGETLYEEFLTTPPVHGAKKVGWKRVKLPSKSDYGTPVIAFGGDSNVIFQQYPYPNPLEITRPTPSYSPQSLWGNTFVDSRLRLGCISLHFVSPTESYFDWGKDSLLISTLSNDYNGPFPARVAIQDISYTNPRTIVGSVYWLQETGRPIKDTTKWTFTFRFDSKYTCVELVSIEVVNWQYSTRFCPSLFRHCFCNAALFDAFHQEEVTSSFAAIENRLHEEGICRGSIKLVQEIWKVAQKRNRANPVTF